MAVQQLVTTAPTALPEVQTHVFQAALRGALLRPGDADYDAARTVFNAMIDKRPALIARCVGSADVVRAVRFAREHDLLVAVRGTGHNVTGNAVCDGGLVIDLSVMKGVRIDPAARTARVEPGVTLGELNREAQAFGLGATGGYVSTTGVAGLTLGGGLGWLVRKHGLALDNLLAADVVTADGQLLTASPTAHPDLFWGLRGGGGNFGVVTSFEFRLHPVGTVLAGIVLYPIAKATDLWRFYRECVATAPDELEAAVALLTSPDGAPVAAIALVYAGTAEAGERVLRPFRAFGPPLADLIQPMPYAAAQTIIDAIYPPGLHTYWKSNFLKDLGDDAIETIVARFARVPSPRTVVHVEHLGGAVGRVAEDATAYAHRDREFNFLVDAMWADPANSEANIRWARETWEAMQPFAADAVYVNYLDREGQERVKAAYGANYARLAALKTKYDPTNVFRLNQNIRPSQDPASPRDSEGTAAERWR